MNKYTGKISLKEKKIFGFCKYTSELLEEMVVDRLIQLIRQLIDFRHSQTGNSAGNTFRDIDLISFKASDMVRGRFMGNQKQVLAVFSGI